MSKNNGFHRDSGFVKAKKSLGQNFCVDNRLVEEIMQELAPTESHLIWEIGPGKGALTRLLLTSSAEIQLFEIDERMRPILADISPSLDICWGDFLELSYEELAKVSKPLLVCGNLPYYCATAIIKRFLEEGPLPAKMIFLLQREVAEKAAAKVGDKNYSYFSLYMTLFAHSKLGGIYPPTSFRPMPKIDSRILILEPIKLTETEKAERMQILTYASVLFSQRRKFAISTLKKHFPNTNWELLFEELQINKTVRPENISPEQMFALLK